MSKRIYVGNLPFSASDDEVRIMFAKFGDVRSTNVNEARPRSATVEMGSAQAAQKAVQALDKSSFGGKVIEVKLA